jgi:hypothetical protein
MHRRTTPKVRGGRVQKKNRSEPSQPSDGDLPAFERERPGRGYRHLLRRRDIKAFVGLLPNWDELAVGLERIVLAREDDAMGYHEAGAVAICAWEEELWWRDTDPEWHSEHREILERLAVEKEKVGGRLVLKWTEPQARAFQLVHVFVHELAHHHDRMSTKSQKAAARGEAFAEAYARELESEIWPQYVERFGI